MSSNQATSLAELPDILRPYTATIDELCRIGNIFWQRGWSRGTSSNYSVVVRRDPKELLITASGKDKGKLGPTDFVLIDSRGQPVCEGQPASSAETLLHCLAVEDDSVGAVLHTHSVWSTILSAKFGPLGGVLAEGYEMLKGLSGVTTHQHTEWFPIFPNTQDIPALAEQVKASFQQAEQPLHAYLIHQHGLYTWGKDLEEAFRHVEIIEFLLEVLARRAGC